MPVQSNPVLQYISDGLSLVTIGICLVMKIPQINKILESKSAIGISVTSLLLELVSYSIITVYNVIRGYSLLTWLECPIILVQQCILIYLVLKYSNLLNIKILLAVFIYVLIFVGFFTHVLPIAMLTVFLPICTPGSASSKIIQLIAILRAKNADAVSLMTWVLSVFMSSSKYFITPKLSRIFTTWMDSADVALLTNATISTVLSSLVLLAAFHYTTDDKKTMKAH